MSRNPYYDKLCKAIERHNLKRFWCWRNEEWLYRKDSEIAEMSGSRRIEVTTRKCEHGDVVIVDHKVKKSSQDTGYKTVPVCINCSGKTLDEIQADGLKHVMRGGV